VSDDVSDEGLHPENRRIDRIRDPAYLEGLDALDLAELRHRRDECLAEREYLSLLRRLVQGRAEILRAELEHRGEDGDRASLIDGLATILAGDEHPGGSRGEAVHVGVPDEELVVARRRIERLVADAGISDPTELDDEQLAEAVTHLTAEEHEVSRARAAAIEVLDRVQDELKRRYKEDPTLALR
jgi:hypothetical protein